MPLRLHLLRHGQTPASRANVFCGRGLDPDLTPDGAAMADAFAYFHHAVLGTRWRAVYASPLRRTRATAAPGADNPAADADVLVVSHKATIRVALCGLLGVDVGRFRFRFACPTSSVSVVEFGPHGPMALSVADRAHLDARLRGLPGT